jgi:hypothetical protein
VKIINIDTDGKWGFYKFTSNDGNKLTCSEYLRSSDGGWQNRGKQTVGSVTWNASKNSNVHHEGALVIPCTANGTPFGCVGIILGAGSMLRGYGKERNRLDTEYANGNFIKSQYIHSDFGQAARFDVVGRQLGYQLLIGAIRYPEDTLA